MYSRNQHNIVNHLYLNKLFLEKESRAFFLIVDVTCAGWDSFKHFFHGTFSPIVYAAAAVAKSLQSCLTLCDPIDSSPPGSPVPGILQARTLEWAAISFSNA